MRIIRLKEVTHLTGLARSTIYKYLAEQRFPKSVPLGDRSIGFLESEIKEWILDRIKERDVSK